MSRVDRTRLPDVGADPAFGLPEVVHHRLANGLVVHTVEHAALPVVTLAAQIEGGSGADAPGDEGLGGLLADMVDEGTGELSAIDVSDALARLGADYEVDVGADATTFAVTTLTASAERGARLLADLVIRPSLRRSDFDRVRQLRLDRLRQLRDLPSAVAERTFLGLLYGAHPYGHLSIGTEAALGRLTLDAVEAAHRARMHPARTTLVAAGARSHQGLLRIADEAFGAWSHGGDAADRGPVAADVATPPATHGLALAPRPGAAQSELRIGHVSARRTTPDYMPLLVMNAVLGGQFVSRVNLKLREEKAVTYGARTAFDWRRGPSPFTLATSVHTAATLAAVQDAIAEISAIRGPRPATGPELALAKASLTRGYPRNFETVQQVARGVAHIALYGLPDTYFADFVPAVHAVTLDDVTRAARAHLDPDRLTVVVVGDPAAIGDPSALELPSLPLTA